jgi:hypothetical protein
MAAVIKKSTAMEFDRPSGPQVAVICDITDPFKSYNKLTGEYKPTMIIVYQLSTTYEFEGQKKRHLISEWCTPSMHSMSKFRARLEGLLGRKLADKDIPEEFRCADLIGKPVLLNLVKDDKGQGYSQVIGISALPAGTPEIRVENYVRPAWVAKQMITPVDPSQDASTAVATATLGDALAAKAPVAVVVPTAPVVVPTAPVVVPTAPKKIDLDTLFRGI